MSTPRPLPPPPIPARPVVSSLPLVSVKPTIAASPSATPPAAAAAAVVPNKLKEENIAPPPPAPVKSNKQLWAEVGLIHDGIYNYDPACLELTPVELHALNDEFLAHRKLFGFQQDNVRNQMEHLCFLIQNARDRYGASAYQYLHNRLFSNYRRWCIHINAQRWCFQRRIKHNFDSPSYGDRNKIQDLVLWLLIWGEAANLRHCPEYLCFVFYRMSMERQSVIDRGVIDRDHFNDEWFRCHVIEPAYNIAFAMQQYVRNNGSLKDHPKRPNYDDINESFWNRAWLDENKTYHDEDKVFFWGLKYFAGGLIDVDPKTGRVIQQKAGKYEDELRKDAIRRKLKTFPEKRSWLNLFRSFHRIVELHLFALHILILFGYDFILHRDWRNISTCVLTPAGLAVLLEIVEFGFYYGIIFAQGLFWNMIIRLIVYTAVFCILLYLYLIDFEYLIYVAVAYLALRVLWELVNITTHRWIRKWHMSEDRNFESDVASQLGVRRRIGSTIFWFVIFIGKCFYSHFTYIRPIIEITRTLTSIPGWLGQAGIGPDNSSSLSNWLLIVLLWLPSIIMFLIDTQIFFSTTIVILGLIIGVRDRVSNIRSWDDIEKSFTYSWRNGARKFFGRDHTNSISIGIEKYSTTTMNTLQLPPIIQPPWHLIQVMWKAIVAEMRAADHTSYHDDQLLQFGHFTYLNPRKELKDAFFLPPFVTSGEVGTLLEILGELQDSRDRRLGGMSMLLKEVRSQLLANETMRTALDEIYIGGTLLLQSFFPESPVEFDLESGNRLLEYTCRQKKPYSFLKDVIRTLEQTVNECIALAFDKGHTNIIRKRPTISNINLTQEETIKLEESGMKLPEKVNTKAFETQLQGLYKFWMMIAEGSGKGGLNADPDRFASGAAIASNVAPPKVDLSMIDDLSSTQLPSLLRTIYHLISTANVDARPSNQSIQDRLMFFLSSLNTRMPERQNSIREMYSWTVLTPYVEELVIYTPEELELPNSEGITAEFYLRCTHKREWLAFLERMASDPRGTNTEYRLLQKREWCSYRGQTLLRTVRGMMYYEYGIKLLTLLELGKGGSITSEQELFAQHLSQRKFQYVLSCQKFGAFREARLRRDRGELIDRPNLPDSVRAERKRLMDEAQKADDIEYIMRKHPHLRISYVDDYQKDNQKTFASVLIKAAPPPDDELSHSGDPAGDVGKVSHRDALIARARSEQARQDDLARRGGFEVAGGGVDQMVGAGVMIEDVDADKMPPHGADDHAAGGKFDRSPHGDLLNRDSHAPIELSEIQEIYRVRLPGPIMIGEGKPENQNHAMIFTRGEFLEAIDMNQDNYLEEAFKMRNLLEEFDPLREDDMKKHHRDELQRPSPIQQGASGKNAAKNGILKCAILGFRENIFTGNLMSVGTYMSLMEATFVSITLRTFAWLGSRMHYGHPDVLDKLFFVSRGGMSKSSKMLHVSEDIFAGFKSTLRGGRILHKEYIQCGKGRDLGFNQLFLFEAKLASGAGEQALSREAYRLGRYLDLPRLMSFFYGSIGFYTTTALIIVSIGTLLFARMMIALTGVDQRVVEFNEQFGTSVGLLQASSVYQLGLLLILPMLAEIALEKTVIKAITTYIWMLITGAVFFFFFHTQTKAFFFNNSVMYGGAKYRATGRGFALTRDSFTRIYRTYARSHFYPAMKFLFMMTVFGIFNRGGVNWFIEMWAPLFLVIAWLYAPMWFNPMSFDHDKVMADFREWLQWLDRKSLNEENSWQGWWIMETEVFQRTPRSTKLWLTLFNMVIPGLIIMAAISALEANEVSRVYFLLISVGATVGLVVLTLFLIYQFHPVGDAYRWMKFVIGTLLLALLVMTVIFDTGTATFGWKGTNFIVYLIVISLTFNAICKVLMIHGAGPYRFGFCMTWFRYCDIIFGLIVYTPWLILSFIGLASVQTRLLYNRAFLKGMKVSALLHGDPNRKEQHLSEKTLTKAPSSNKLGPGFTPLNITRENSMEDISKAAGGGAADQRAGMNLMVPEPSLSNRSKNSNNYSHASNISPSYTPYGVGSRRSSVDVNPDPVEREVLLRPGSSRGDHESLTFAHPNLLIYSQSPSGVGSNMMINQTPQIRSAAAPTGNISNRYNPNSANRSAEEEKAPNGQQQHTHPRYTYN